MLKKPKKDTFYEQNKKFSMEKEAMSTLWAHDVSRKAKRKNYNAELQKINL